MTHSFYVTESGHHQIKWLPSKNRRDLSNRCCGPIRGLLSRDRGCCSSNTSYWPSAGEMLAQRLRRWPSISQALGQYSVFAEWSSGNGLTKRVFFMRLDLFGPGTDGQSLVVIAGSLQPVCQMRAEVVCILDTTSATLAQHRIYYLPASPPAYSGDITPQFTPCVTPGHASFVTVTPS